MTEHEITALREQYAAIAHDAWSGWMRWMLPKLWLCDVQPDGSLTLTARADHWLTDESRAWLERWMRQAATSYAELSEGEKESDRIEADKYIAALSDYLAARQTVVAQLERERDAVLEALRQVTYYHHDDYDYCVVCERALTTWTEVRS